METELGQREHSTTTALAKRLTARAGRATQKWRIRLQAEPRPSGSVPQYLITAREIRRFSSPPLPRIPRFHLARLLARHIPCTKSTINVAGNFSEGCATQPIAPVFSRGCPARFAGDKSEVPAGRGNDTGERLRANPARPRTKRQPTIKFYPSAS